MNRREGLGRIGVGIGVGAVGLAAGVGTWWATGGGGGGASEARLDDEFWALSLRSAAGGEVALSSFRGRNLLVNFWATWCAPCIREMPALDRFQARHAAAGWQVLGLAVDAIAPVLVFSQKVKVGYPLLVADGAGLLLSRRLGNPGGLPFTVMADATGKVRFSKAGETSLEELERVVASRFGG